MAGNRSGDAVEPAGLEELRRRAFSRGGTEADFRALAEALVATEPGHDSPDAEPDPGPPSFRRVPTPVWIIAAGVAGLAVGALAASYASRSPAAPVEETPPAAVSSLTIFDRADERPGEAVPPDDFERGGFSNVEVRFLDDVADGSVYAAQARTEMVNFVVGMDGQVVTGETVSDTQICLIYARAVLGSTWACTPSALFHENGVETVSETLSLRWGPTGSELWVSTH